MSSRPNVLFIVADQHNAKVLGHEGHPDVQTPHLDRMAAEGTRFTRCITQNPICTPSRTSFLSGQYCHNHGYYGLSGPNPGGLPNVLGHLRRSGYHTAALGKIHCPEYWVEDVCDEFHETCATSVVGRSEEYTEFLTARGKEHLEDHGAMPEFGPKGRQSMEGRPSPLAFDEAQEGWIADTAIRIMGEAAARDQPFLVHASLPRPHQCTAPSPEFWELYEGRELALPPNADGTLEGKAPHLRAGAERWRRGEWTLFEPHTFEAGRQRKLHGYLGAVSQVDAAVGKMLNFLRSQGLADDTIVIYTSDHGDYAAEHDIMEKAPGICSDAITRVPMLWWGGGVTPGQVADELVELIDIVPTLTDWCGAEALETADGHSLAPLLRGGRGEVRSLAVTECPWSKSVRVGHWRYVHYAREMFPQQHPEGFGELYDLDADPWELENRFFDASQADRVAEMRHVLLDWLVTTTRPATALGANSGGRRERTAQRVERFRTVVNADGKITTDALRRIAGGNYL